MLSMKLKTKLKSVYRHNKVSVPAMLLTFFTILLTVSPPYGVFTALFAVQTSLTIILWVYELYLLLYRRIVKVQAKRNALLIYALKKRMVEWLHNELYTDHNEADFRFPNEVKSRSYNTADELFADFIKEINKV